MKYKFLIPFFALCISSSVFADEIDNIEGLFDEEGQQQEQQVRREAKRAERRAKKTKERATKLENLNSLKTFEGVAIIQKRYLPKTKRFEAYLSAATNVNDDYFTAYGINASLAYNFTEKFGIEAMFKWFDVSNSDVANDLLDRLIVTNGLVGTELYYGLHLKWSPIYGKFSYFDRKIIPFDHYFSVGVGITNTVTGASSKASLDVQEADESPFTIHLGTGQIFALTKWMAFRWDLSYHWYQNTSPLVTSGATTLLEGGNKEAFSNIFLGFGLSFYFPEATYR